MINNNLSNIENDYKMIRRIFIHFGLRTPRSVEAVVGELSFPHLFWRIGSVVEGMSAWMEKLNLLWHLENSAMMMWRRAVEIARGSPRDLDEIRCQARSLYRQFLRLSDQLPDPVLSEYIKLRTRTRFRLRSDLVSFTENRRHLAEARRQRHKLGLVLAGENKEYKWLIEMSYGLRGKFKHLWQMVGTMLCLTPFSSFLIVADW